MLLVLALLGCRNEPQATTSAPTPSKANGAQTSACGELPCQRFASSVDALRFVLARRPRVLAFGESHALKGAQDVLTTTERFRDDFLPVLREAGATTLVVELIQPPTGCEVERAAVEQVQKPVLERQDSGNQERFIDLGHRARALGIVPLILEPSCADFTPVRQAGPDGVVALLELIALQTRGKLERLAPKTSAPAIIVAYGGAIHNDIAGPGEAKPFSFGGAVSRAVQGEYVAVDLIVPEYVGDNEAWQALPWHRYWPDLAKEGVVLIEAKPSEFTIIVEAGRGRKAGTSTAVAPQ